MNKEVAKDSKEAQKAEAEAAAAAKKQAGLDAVLASLQQAKKVGGAGRGRAAGGMQASGGREQAGGQHGRARTWAARNMEQRSRAAAAQPTLLPLPSPPLPGPR